jgi:hypothetical protein
MALAADLLALYSTAKAAPMSEADFANGVAAAIDKYVKTATVLVNGVTPGSGSATGGLS